MLMAQSWSSTVIVLIGIVMVSLLFCRERTGVLMLMLMLMLLPLVIIVIPWPLRCRGATGECTTGAAAQRTAQSAGSRLISACTPSSIDSLTSP